MNYIEAVAIDWAENNIDTVEKAEEYISRFKNQYIKILNALGITGRIPIKGEIDFMKKWTDEYNMPIEIILDACEKTILNTGKSSFSYADGIISNWYKSNVTTLEDIEKINIEFKDNKSFNQKKKPLQKQNVKATNKIVNYDGRNWDYDKLEKLNQKLLEN